jgi:hypothetical protein
MAASSVQLDHHQTRSMNNRQTLLGDLNVHVPANIFHLSTKSASCDLVFPGPIAVSVDPIIRTSLGSGKQTPRPPKNLCYTRRAQNFDEGGGDEEDELKHRCFSPRHIPRRHSRPRSWTPAAEARDGNRNETPARETGFDSK